MDNMALAALVADEIRAWHPDAVFIDEGNGSGVIDRLRQLGFSPIGVHFGGKATQPRYTNKRTEMWWGDGRVAAQRCGAADPAGAQDRPRGAHLLVRQRRQAGARTKDDIKARIKVSPDLGTRSR